MEFILFYSKKIESPYEILFLN